MGNNCISRLGKVGFWFKPPKGVIGESESKGKEKSSDVQFKAPEVVKIGSKLGRQESRLSRQESRLGRQESRVNRQESQLGKQENRLGRQESRLGRQESRLGRQESRLTRQESRTISVNVNVGDQEKNKKQQQPPVNNNNNNVKRVSSAGLQVHSVLRRKTGNLKEFYTLGKKLGHGQFGTTFLCVEKTSGNEFACKSIAKRKLVNKEDVDDVRREIQIMHHLKGHPNVITIKDAYEDGAAVHVVMELCAGGELFDRIVKRGHYTERKAAYLARIIVSVVEACHSLGVMHRDLKPENFLFVNEKEESPLKTIDFGLSIFFKPGILLKALEQRMIYILSCLLICNILYAQRHLPRGCHCCANCSLKPAAFIVNL